ncbi:MAG: DUF2267 domain-containing protein [Longimicrobiales bacterium]|nr:DUF2267 domain-containing protein [Longimicrobiales bacterium]
MSEHVNVPQLRRATQQTQEWIKELSNSTVFEAPEQAYSYLRAVLHALRDRMTVEEATHFAAQLPMMVRGFYYEGWRPALAPNDYETADVFYERVKESLGGTPGLTAVRVAEGTRAVMELLESKVDPGQMKHLSDQLPKGVADELFAEIG